MQRIGCEAIIVLTVTLAATVLAQEPQGTVFSGVHNPGTAKDADKATAGPDDISAVLAPNQWITLDLPSSWTCSSDGSDEGPEVEVFVGKESPAYKVEIATDHNHFTEITGDSQGDRAFDTDHHNVRSFRYVRIRNVGRSDDLHLDAVRGTRCGYAASNSRGKGHSH